MAAKTVAVSANSIARIAEARPAKMASGIMVWLGSLSEELHFLLQDELLVFPLPGWLLVCPLLWIFFRNVLLRGCRDKAVNLPSNCISMHIILRKNQLILSFVIRGSAVDFTC